MRPLPTDNQRPAILLAILTAMAVAALTLAATVWIQFQAEDRGYTTELRGALRKYGTAAAVPAASVQWLARVHEREAQKVRADLAAAAEDPTAFDPLEPLHLEPALPVQLYLDLGFVGLWVVLGFAGMLVLGPVMMLVNRLAQPPRRRPPPDDAAWQ